MKLMMVLVALGAFSGATAGEIEHARRKRPQRPLIDYAVIGGAAALAGVVMKNDVQKILIRYPHRFPVFRMLAKQRDMCLAEHHGSLNAGKWDRYSVVSGVMQKKLGMLGNRYVLSTEVVDAAEKFFCTMVSAHGAYARLNSIDAQHAMIPYGLYLKERDAIVDYDLRPKVANLTSSAKAYDEALAKEMDKKALWAARAAGLLTAAGVVAAMTHE